MDTPAIVADFEKRSSAPRAVIGLVSSGSRKPSKPPMQPFARPHLATSRVNAAAIIGDDLDGIPAIQLDDATDDHRRAGRNVSRGLRHLAHGVGAGLGNRRVRATRHHRPTNHATVVCGRLKQRVSLTLQHADHRADAPSLDQPMPAARLPQAAGATAG
jgi:hypothetical protein